MSGGEVMFYTNLTFGKIIRTKPVNLYHVFVPETYDYKLVEKGATDFKLSSGSAPNHVAIYVPAVGNNPARVRVHRVALNFPVVANRTFFKSDKATMTWNQRGNALLILASVEVDKTNQSYYGEQSVSLSVDFTNTFFVFSCS